MSSAAVVTVSAVVVYVTVVLHADASVFYVLVSTFGSFMIEHIGNCNIDVTASPETMIF